MLTSPTKCLALWRPAEALLIVDAAQGVEAQSVANCYTAIAQGLEVIPVLNKMDLPQAEPEKVINEIEDIIGIEATDAVRCSAKTGDGIKDILEELVEQVPAPVGDTEAPLQALIIDSWFDNYLGVVSLVRVMGAHSMSKIKLLPSQLASLMWSIVLVFSRPSELRPAF